MWSFLGQSHRERRLRTATLLAAGAGLLFTAWVTLGDPFGSVQSSFVDSLFMARDGSPNIVIVRIGEDDLAEHGRIQQWPRSLHAAAIANLQDAGARVIVYDIIFADAGTDDAALVGAVAEADAVVLAVAGGSPARAPDGSLVYGTISKPVAPLRETGAVLGHANVLTDSDGRVRRLPLVIGGADGQQYASLALSAFYLQFGLTIPDTFDLAEDGLKLPGRTIPLEDDFSLRINYVGGVDRFSSIDFSDVLEGRFDPGLVDGKVVFIGVFAPGADIHSAPLLDQASGVELHANALDTLFRARFLRPVGAWTAFAILAALSIGAGLLLPRLRVWLGIVAVVVAVLAYLVVGVTVFRGGYILDFVYPPAALGLVAVVALAYRAVAERATRQDLEELFGRYVSPPVAEELVERADRGDLHLGGELREVTVMFADIRGFTPLAGRMEAQELVNLLNRYFDILVSEIMEHRGIVNKFGGDAVMAIWNAPKDEPEHTLLACSAAIAAQRQLESLGSGEPVARWGFGIHSGVALAGNVGAIGRLEYTVIGDSVNLAARLAGAAGPGEIWVSEETFQRVRGHLKAEQMPPQHLKGIEKPISVYSLIWEVPETDVQAEV